MIGIDHPFQVAATTIGDGRVAVYDTSRQSGPPSSSTPAKIDERVADAMFVLDSLRSDHPELALYAPSADLKRMAVIGHSAGGMTASEVYRIELSISTWTVRGWVAVRPWP